MNLNSLDLNLLTALDALLRDASVSRAAMRLHLSQPAASHALQRLRDLIGDPLLVRSGARMELTPRAQALRAPLAQALDQVRALFVPDAFDAVSSDRHFRLMMPDLAVELLMPPLMEKVTRIAPHVTIDVVPWRGPAIFTAEFARTIDLVISIGDACLQGLSPPAPLCRRRRTRGAPRPSRRSEVEEARNVPCGKACRRRDPWPERGSDR
ncbi:DNA-binding transcriptional LysR family regulator [Bradyrhizobium sp. USDA 10063]